VTEEGATRRRQFNAASAAYQKWRAYLVLKISNLPTQGWL
jgi:hypothetical protein